MAILWCLLMVSLLNPQQLYAQSIKQDTLATDSLVFSSVQNPLPLDSLLSRIEFANATLNRINQKVQIGTDYQQIKDELPLLQAQMVLIQSSVSEYESVLNVKDLQTFQVLLTDIEHKLDKWQTALSAAQKQWLLMNEQIQLLSENAGSNSLPKDSLFLQMYGRELTSLRDKWIAANRSLKAIMGELTPLRINVSDSHMRAQNLQTQVSNLMVKNNLKAFDKQYPYLWNSQSEVALNPIILKQVVQAYQNQQQLLGYYFQNNGTSWLWFLGISVVFFYWVRHNFKKVRLLNPVNSADASSDIQLQYLKARPIGATLIVGICLSPLYDLHAPASYLESILSYLLLVLTIFFVRHWPRKQLYYWLGVVFLFLIAGFINESLPNHKLRIGLVILNLVSIAYGYWFLKKIQAVLEMPKLVRVLGSLYIILNTLAILTNLLGRFSLAKMFTMTAFLGLIQLVGLMVFVKIITEAFYLQISASRQSGGITARFNYDRIEHNLNQLLSVVIVGLWLIVFTSNLNLYNGAYALVDGMLTTPHTIGNIAFTLSNLIWLLLILIVSNLLQKYIGYFFGETDEDIISSKKGARLVIIRLIILLGGFLLAIAASGLPLDKATVMFGALGVGIGLGMQNIINNLVSGIILIFERPFSIGDYIEVAGKKGRVKNISIRSSKLLTHEGSEVIVPNGDLLSGHVINWSLNKNQVRLEFTIRVDSNSLSLAEDMIRQEMTNEPNVAQRIPPEIFINGITGEIVELKVSCWISDINKSSMIKSALLANIYNRLKEHQIKLI